MMQILRSLAVLGAALPLCLGQALPLHTSSRWILDANNNRVKLRCVNWVGHLDTNIPEGLNKQSLDTLTSFVANQGFNCVRLTYSIDHALNQSVSVADSFAAASLSSGVSVGSFHSIYASALALNPFLGTSTRGQVFAAVIDSLWSKGVMTILDNHVSKASWCCNYTDGNGWWNTASGYDADNSRYFVTSDWLNGLQAMATFALDHPGVVGMSLRNEIRQIPVLNSDSDWYKYIEQGGSLVHSTNPNVLVIVGGTFGAMDLSMIKVSPLDTSGWPGKHVWEFHAYSFSALFPRISNWCWTVTDEYGLLDGFVLEQGKSWTGPLFLSEFGTAQDGSGDSTYLGCLVGYMENNDAEWAIWGLMGSYYVRDGTLDYDESYGVMNHDWTGLRDSGFHAKLGNMWSVTQGP